MYPIILETHGNQRYVFALSRFKESVGASYLFTLFEPWMRSTSWHEKIFTLDISVSPGEVIVAVDSEKDAHSLVSAVTRKILETAPGVDVVDVFTPMISVHVTKGDLENVHAASARHALTRPPVSVRFCSTPFPEPGRDTLLPVVPSRVGFPPGEVYSLPGAAARVQTPKAREYLLGLASTHPHLSERSEELPPDPDALEKAFDSSLKIAVIHLDGNGVGATVRGLADRLSSIPVSIFQGQIKCDASNADAPRLGLLKLNKHLDNVMKDAFCDAWAAVADLVIQEGIDVVPVVSVILGGDDATVTTDGASTIPFAVIFLGVLEERIGVDPFISSLSDDGRMTVGAGVAVVRHNFPFHLTHDLAKRLVSTAKTADKRMGELCSTLSYRILYDSTVLDPEELLASYTPFTNEAETAQSTPAMTSRPYRIPVRKEPSIPLPPPTMNEPWDAMRFRVT